MNSLPTASSTYHGRLLLLPGTGGLASDKLYVCVRWLGNYTWKSVNLL